MPVIIGTSGWQYKDWRGRFYPEKLAQARWLEHYAERFKIVEVNNSFYHLPKPETFAAWAQRTPDDFIVGVKVSRYLTHIKRLREPEEPVTRFMTHARNLGSKLGPLLIQLPPRFKADLASLDETLGLFGPGERVTVEFRDDSWFTEEARELLTKHGAALSLADRGSRPIGAIWRTADWGYVRFHEGRAWPLPCYGRRALRTWVERIAEMWGPDADVYVFFNNDPGGCAVRDAIVFAEEAERAGLTPTRVPDIDEVKVGIRWGS